MLAYVAVGPRIRTLIPDGHTLTEYAYVRYGRTVYVYVVCVSVFYMFIFLVANMTGIVGVLSLVAGVPTWQTAGVIGLIAVAYTTYGGLRAPIVTDAVQLVLILPLLGMLFLAALVSLGGPAEIGATVAATDSQLLEPGFLPGVQFGVYVVVAIVAAEMLNQSWWQRIYAARDVRTVRRSFAYAAFAVIPIILLAGSFDVIAVGYDMVREPGDASIALFLVVLNALPDWVGLVLVLLAVLLVASTADTLFSAISCIVAADLP